MRNKIALIIEPQKNIDTPYNFIPHSYNTHRVASLEHGLKYMSATTPDIAFLSTSPATSKILTFLEALKTASHNKLIPLVFVVDLSQKLSTIPGTTWGGKLGILTSISSESEMHSTLDRIMSA